MEKYFLKLNHKWLKLANAVDWRNWKRDWEIGRG